MNIHLEYRVEVFEEDGQYVALCPELNVSSFGDSVEEAKRALQEAVALFLEECESMGTLHEVLSEAGFTPDPDQPSHWRCRKPVLTERATL
ncbi:MAG: type II toxin-antitoxin system HicB family antitoxin [Candidatus Brocadiales bacterium]|nr:type II toxin-antitoxin system HicB family antitoxin [Candidatus Brocadiales bacterium]